MIEKSIKPNIWTYNALIWLYRFNYQQALAVLEIEMPKQNVRPNVVTYTELMNISRNFDYAVGLFEEMCRNKISANERTYQVIEALAGKDTEKLKKLFELRNYSQK